VVPLLLVCACGRVAFDPLQGPPALDDSGIEGMSADDGPMTSDDAPTGACTAPGDTGSTFPGGLPCSNWQATPTMINAGISESSGQLSITPNANTTGAQAYCTKNNVPFGPGGAIVEVSVVLNGSAITAIQLGLGPTALSMVVQNGMLIAQDASGDKGMVAYSTTTTRFWRIRPNTGSGVIFEYGDGMTWTKLGVSAQTPQATYNTLLLAGEIGAIANPGTARFESVNLCP